MYNLVLDLIGKPYREYGELDDNKYDCWDLVREVYKRVGITLPEYIISEYNLENINGKIESARPMWERLDTSKPLPVPCAILIHPSFDMCTHVGVYLGIINGSPKFIHSNVKRGVCIESLDSMIWKRLIEGFYSYKG